MNRRSRLPRFRPASRRAAPSPATTTSEPSPWAALAIPPYRTLFFSAAIVIFGVMGQAVARGWLARELTGNNTGLGGVMLAFGASMLISTPIGGVAADRYRKRTVLLLSVVVLTLTSILIGIAVVADQIEYWMLLVASGLQASAFAFYLPARIALISEIVEARQLKNAIVLAQMSQETMRVFAPALAGILVGVAWFGVGGVFLASGVAIALAAVMLLSLPSTPAREAGDASPFSEIADAVQYMRHNPDVGLVALLTVGVVMVGFPYLTFLPTLADARFGTGATGYGIMSGVAGLGALAAGGLDAVGNRGLRPRRTIVLAGLALGAALVLLGLAPTYATALVALLAVGASALVFQTSTQALMLSLSPIEYHGRLQSMVILGFSGFGLAALPLGLLADAVTLGTTLAGMGVVIMALNGWFAVARRRRLRSVGPAME